MLAELGVVAIGFTVDTRLQPMDPRAGTSGLDTPGGRQRTTPQYDDGGRCRYACHFFPGTISSEK